MSRNITCYGCEKSGHIRTRCPNVNRTQDDNMNRNTGNYNRNNNNNTGNYNRNDNTRITIPRQF